MKIIFEDLKSLHLIWVGMLLILISCNNISTPARNDKTNSANSKIDYKYTVKKDSLLFLDFWFGMSEKDYQIVEDSLVKISKLWKKDSLSVYYTFKLSKGNKMVYRDAKLLNKFKNNKLKAIKLIISDDSCCENSFESDFNEISKSIYGYYKDNNCVSNSFLNGIIDLYTEKYGSTEKIIAKVDSNYVAQWNDDFSIDFNDENSYGYIWRVGERLISIKVFKENNYLLNSFIYYMQNNSSIYSVQNYSRLKILKVLGEYNFSVSIIYTFDSYQNEIDKKNKEILNNNKAREKIEADITQDDI